MDQEDEKKEIMMEFFNKYYKKITNDTPDTGLDEQYFSLYKDKHPWDEDLAILKTDMGLLKKKTLGETTREKYFRTLRNFRALPSAQIVELEPEPELESEPESKKRDYERYMDTLKGEEKRQEFWDTLMQLSLPDLLKRARTAGVLNRDITDIKSLRVSREWGDEEAKAEVEIKKKEGLVALILARILTNKAASKKKSHKKKKKSHKKKKSRKSRRRKHTKRRR